MTNKINIQIKDQGRKHLQYLKLTRNSFQNSQVNRDKIVTLLVKWKGNEQFPEKMKSLKALKKNVSGIVSWCTHSRWEIQMGELCQIKNSQIEIPNPAPRMTY